MAIEDDIKKAQDESRAALEQADKLKKMLEEYPDLQKFVGRWNKVVYYSKSVNGKVNRFDLRHNCGCCNDSPLELWPYIETPNGNVYSDPPRFSIGERHWISGDKPYKGWKAELEKAGIPEAIIGAVGVHFDRCKQERIEVASSEDDDE